MSPADQFLQEMQKRRTNQLQQIRGMFGDNPGKGLGMQPAQTRPGFVGNIIRAVTGLVSGNALQAGLQTGLSSSVGNLASLFGGSSIGGIGGSSIGGMAAGTSLENPALFNAAGQAASGLAFF